MPEASDIPRSSSGPAAYRGRFAPSPTGPLHFGSLIAATGSYLAARHAGGDWIVRIEDIDRPREVAGSADQIVRALDAFGFEWTESIVRQSDREEAYAQAAARLLEQRAAFHCSCSRKEIAAATDTTRTEEEARYPGWCRSGPRREDAATAIRFRVDANTVAFHDELQGAIAIDVHAESGDFVIRRRDQLYAYQLAVVVDDAAQGITHVVRGADLLSSTPRQMLLQKALKLPTPVYAHLPLATDASGIKLSKSTGAAALDLTRTGAELWKALDFLRQEPPPDLRGESTSTLWQWAIKHWRPATLTGVRGMPMQGRS
jgi:glutamyl-Q tRNA(Asp) synthetase